MANSRSVRSKKTVTKTPKKEKDSGSADPVCRKVKAPQLGKGSAARKRKTSSAESAAGELMKFSQKYIKKSEPLERKLTSRPCCRSTETERESNQAEQQIKNKKEAPLNGTDVFILPNSLIKCLYIKL